MNARNLLGTGILTLAALGVGHCAHGTKSEKRTVEIPPSISDVSAPTVAEKIPKSNCYDDNLKKILNITQKEAIRTLKEDFGRDTATLEARITNPTKDKYHEKCVVEIEETLKAKMNILRSFVATGKTLDCRNSVVIQKGAHSIGTSEFTYFRKLCIFIERSLQLAKQYGSDITAIKEEFNNLQKDILERYAFAELSYLSGLNFSAINLSELDTVERIHMRYFSDFDFILELAEENGYRIDDSEFQKIKKHGLLRIAHRFVDSIGRKRSISQKDIGKIFDILRYAEKAGNDVNFLRTKTEDILISHLEEDFRKQISGMVEFSPLPYCWQGISSYEAAEHLIKRLNDLKVNTVALQIQLKKARADEIWAYVERDFDVFEKKPSIVQNCNDPGNPLVSVTEPLSHNLETEHSRLLHNKIKAISHKLKTKQLELDTYIFVKQYELNRGHDAAIPFVDEQIVKLKKKIDKLKVELERLKVENR